LALQLDLLGERAGEDGGESRGRSEDERNGGGHERDNLPCGTHSGRNGPQNEVLLLIDVHNRRQDRPRKGWEGHGRPGAAGGKRTWRKKRVLKIKCSKSPKSGEPEVWIPSRFSKSGRLKGKGVPKLGIAQAKTIKRKVFKKKLGLKQFFF
jgi:ribosomal protein L44E